jgi:hypothetical protein
MHGAVDIVLREIAKALLGQFFSIRHYSPSFLFEKHQKQKAARSGPPVDVSWLLN